MKRRTWRSTFLLTRVKSPRLRLREAGLRSLTRLETNSIRRIKSVSKAVTREEKEERKEASPLRDQARWQEATREEIRSEIERTIPEFFEINHTDST